MLNVAEILNKVNEEGYGVVAIRHCTEDEEYNIGDICRNSFDWNYELDHSTYEDEEQVELNGTCGLHVRGFENFDEEEVEEATELLTRRWKKQMFTVDRLLLSLVIVLSMEMMNTK